MIVIITVVGVIIAAVFIVSFFVPLSDTQSPEFPSGCVPGIHTKSGPKGSAVSVEWSAPRVKDNSGGRVTLSYNAQPGSQFTIGNHDVEVLAEDTASNQRTCTFTVKVEGKPLIVLIFFHFVVPIGISPPPGKPAATESRYPM